MRKTLVLLLPLSLLSACAWPLSVTGDKDDNALGYPAELMPLRAYKPGECEFEDEAEKHVGAKNAQPDPEVEAEAPSPTDDWRYYLFEVDGELRLYEYTGPDSTYMNYYTNGWQKPGETIFFFGDKMGGMRYGELLALPEDPNEQGYSAVSFGGRGGLKLKIEEQADGTYFPSEDSAIIDIYCLEPANDEPFPPAFSGLPPWAGFYTDGPQRPPEGGPAPTERAAPAEDAAPAEGD